MKWSLVITIFGLLLLAGYVNALDYNYVSQYPPGQNSTYVNASTTYDSNFWAWYATDPSKDLVGASTGNQWYAQNGIVTNQVINVDLGSAKVITRIYYENAHVAGASTTRGLKYFTFWGSNSAGSFANRTYSNTTGWTQITAGSLYFDEHAAANATDPKYITLTNTAVYRYYSIRPSSNWGDASIMGIRRIELQSEVAWEYSSPGTFYWVCPLNITSVSLQLGGGGGSGKSAYSYSGYWIGYGGSAGEVGSFSTIAVTPGNNYTVTVGTGGAQSAANAVSNAGTSSTAFGYTKNGGAGGLSVPQITNSNGGNGANGFLTGGNAEAGGDASIYSGGTAGSGYSAGGGGGAAQSGGSMGAGGRGSDGFVGIYQSGYGDLNTPDFTATPTSGFSGTLVHFTDESTIVDSSNLSYLWDFGDGWTSTTIGDTLHVYSAVGSYTVSLTISSTGGVITEEKDAYINLISEPPLNFTTVTQPIAVTFHTQSFFGKAVVGANISVVGITTSTGNWDWIVTLLGIPLGEAGINGTQMYQTSDSLGNAEFLLIPSAKYNVTTTLAGYTFPIFYVSPHDRTYTLIANLNSSEIFGVPIGKSNISVTVNGTRLNNTYARINLTFLDTEGSVTSGNITISRENTTPGGARVTVTTVNITNSSFSNSTILPISSTGTVFWLHSNATSTLETAQVVKDYTVSFAGIPITIPGFTPSLLMLLAFAVIILTGLSSGAIGAPQMSVVCCIEAWVFYAVGAFQPIIDRSGSTTIILTFSFATVFAILWNVREGRRAER